MLHLLSSNVLNNERSIENKNKGAGLAQLLLIEESLDPLTDMRTWFVYGRTVNNINIFILQRLLKRLCMAWNNIENEVLSKAELDHRYRSTLC